MKKLVIQSLLFLNFLSPLASAKDLAQNPSGQGMESGTYWMTVCDQDGNCSMVEIIVNNDGIFWSGIYTSDNGQDGTISGTSLFGTNSFSFSNADGTVSGSGSYNTKNGQGTWSDSNGNSGVLEIDDCPEDE